MTTRLLPPAPGLTGSWDDFPEPTPVTIPDAPPEQPDKVSPDTPGICQVCHEPIIREPGARGRLRKVHPECKPVRTPRSSSPRSGSGKAQSEARTIANKARSGIAKLSIGISLVDQYDAFCLMAGMDAWCEALEAWLVGADKVRKELLRAKEGGSFILLVLASSSIALPIAAHHGLIPNERFREILTNMPKALYELRKRMDEGETRLIDYMETIFHPKAENGDSRPES